MGEASRRSAPPACAQATPHQKRDPSAPRPRPTRRGRPLTRGRDRPQRPCHRRETTSWRRPRLATAPRERASLTSTAGSTSAPARTTSESQPLPPRHSSTSTQRPHPRSSGSKRLGAGQTRAQDDDQVRRGDPCFCAKEQSWHTAWLARSLLSWTKSSSQPMPSRIAGRGTAGSRHKQQSSAARRSVSVQAKPTRCHKDTGRG